MTVRILLISNTCLLVALFFAFNRPMDSTPTPSLPEKRSVRKAVVPMSDSEVLSALPKPRKASSKSSRLANIQRLLKQIERSDRSALYRLQSDLMAKERSGFYDTKIERQLIDYKFGELGGDDPTRWMFPYGDGGVYARALILEGWAHAHPSDALAWWVKLGPGKRRDSLLPQLVQGYLSSEGTTWRTLVPLLSVEELASAAIPILDAAVADDDTSELIALFEDEFAGIESKSPHRLVGMINDILCENRSYEDLEAWYENRQEKDSFGKLGSERRINLVQTMGKTGGAKALKFLPEEERMRAARAWVRSSSSAAKKWLKASRREEGADHVAFHLAIEAVTTDPEQSREWAEFISDEHLAETINEIISGYEAR